MKQHQRIYFLQFVFALSMGALLARLPDLQVQFALTEGQVGLLLITMSCGVLCGLTFLGRTVERFGARATTIITIFGASTFYAIVPWMPSAIVAAPLLFAAGILAGALEINANVEADRYEAAMGRRIMSRVHGMWSLGFFVTALAAAALRQAGVSVEIHMALALLVVVVSGTAVFWNMQTAPKRPDMHGAEHPPFAFPTWGMLPLCLLGAAPLWVEGAGVDWSAIYMRDVFAVEPFVGGLSVTLFSLAIALGRLGMDPVVERFGPRAVATTLLSLAAIGLVLVVAAMTPVMALAGFAIAGIGCSSVYPLAISAAARRTDRPAAVNVAALSQMTFFVFFAGPPLLGYIAEHFGIRFSYLAIIPVLLAALLATRRLRRTA
ncbi:Fucose permease [Devosia lucknowensis]|uniref:Fucose permease n=1 Tax=Devosia lucknowensis TaxID=1096929 RepID=A0A1Y6ESC7_9HYPH|nr:MFS transporter [Devosia lucknowensis]SMQ63392.1 Fucose permease [Devosia lucknowensis]